MAKTAKPIAPKMLAWYDRHRRDLPWRARAGDKPNPYHVWVSEIMLQQTTVPAVMGYFARFLAEFPTVQDLARADLDRVLQLWQGLGYYARARNLHKCAQVIVRDYGGKFPSAKEALKQLPGIGDYTAGAVAAIAFDAHSFAVDANVERVIARLFAITDPLPGSKKIILDYAEKLTPKKRAGDYLQSMMDLGATICISGEPKCSLCPIQDLCQARKLGIQNTLPRKMKKKTKPTRYGWAAIVMHKNGKILLQKRSDKKMLGGMVEIPSSNWDSKSAEQKSVVDVPPGKKWEKLSDPVLHSFTHFDLQMDVYVTQSNAKVFENGFWQDVANIDQVALPTLFKKVLRVAGKK